MNTVWRPYLPPRMRSCVTVTPCHVETGAGVGDGFSDAQYEVSRAIVARHQHRPGRKADLSATRSRALFPQEFKRDEQRTRSSSPTSTSNAHPDGTDTLRNSRRPAVA
ncbi:MAG: hypothetical protein ACLU38_01200 [Dysosmobacter sp.]